MCDTQAGVPSTSWLRAQLAFKDSMVHGILQFTPSIAFRYVLHRCKSRDIRCRESFCIMCRDNTRRTPSPGPQESPFTVSVSLAHKAPGFVFHRERERLGCANHDQPPPDRRGARRTCRPFVGRQIRRSN
ncbi:hypothetical protein VNO78_29272 [Psophocarpus tetragonolobus]|uniref:Uncharacterized protein n=1 Tax=Psophocarpus tetragonolobus TaxID=3891 RepID=A0AAN9X148_PSOTE